MAPAPCGLGMRTLSEPFCMNWCRPCARKKSSSPPWLLSAGDRDLPFSSVNEFFSPKPSGAGEYNDLVRVKTSITLPKALLNRLDRLDKNRSALLERAAVAYLARLDREARDRRDLEILEQNAERLSRDALDTLEYQQIP